jgi:hypothetical protein
VIAEKRIEGKIAFQVHRCLNPFEKETAVVKALSGTDVEAEIKDWAEAGYLLAYGTSTSKKNSFTYLILKINAPDPRPSYKKAEIAMRAAMTREKVAINSDSDSESDKVK